MTRSFHQLSCKNHRLFATLDSGQEKIGLLIVSGGNEIRSGAHAGMSKLAHSLSIQDFPVFRFDRRGVGDSSGDNLEFLSSEQDIAAAVLKFRSLCPNLELIVAFGNCDAATALALYGPSNGIDGLILANPWVIDSTQNETTEMTVPNAAAIRSRYWDRIKNPKSFADLLTGKINILKLIKGLKQAAKKQENGDIALQLRNALVATDIPTHILVASKDTTALAFMSAWKSNDYKELQNRSNIRLLELDSASHSFADTHSKKWLNDQISDFLRSR
ncbi:MAG: hypothetical protein Pars2KO_22260 [Parasphingorhabdus sp.]